MTTPRDLQSDLPRDSDLDAVLRSLDAAGPTSDTLSAAEQQRADSTLETILASPSTAPSAAAGSSRTLKPGAFSFPSPRRGLRPRLLLLAAAAAVATVGVSVLGGGGNEMALASWTPTPTPLSEQEIDLAGPACRDELGEYDKVTLDLNRAQLQLAERRGDVVALLYWTQDPDMAGDCLIRNIPGSDDVEVITSGIAGSSGPALQAPARGYTQGAISQTKVSGAGFVSITSGAVGAEVAGVTIRAGAYTVQATVHEGRYVAWWPGPALGGEPPASSGRDDSTLLLTYDLTLTDGTVVRDAIATLPT